MMLASGTCCVITRLAGSTTNELGAAPNVHCIMAPMQTCIGIAIPPGGPQSGELFNDILLTSHLSRNGIPHTDRKSTRLNSSHLGISYAVFCLKKKQAI